MSKLETLLRDKLESELILQHQLKALSETLHQQLQETEKRQKEELEKRIQQNAFLSSHMGQDLNAFIRQNKTANKGMAHLRLNSSNEYSTHLDPAVKLSEIRQTRTHHCERAALVITQPSKEEEAMAECLKKFSALPVPSHVTVPLFQQLMVKREKQRKQGHEQRKNFLFSMQKPFSFQEREKEKREKLIAIANEASKEYKKNTEVDRKPHKVIQDSKLAQGHCQKTMEDKTSPASQGPKLRTADRTRKERIGFLDEAPSFQPRIIRQVPDFNKLHKALQTEGLKKTQTTNFIKCQPFYLRTSALPARQRRLNHQSSQAQKVVHLSRSKSLGAITSLSSDILPVYITDAARKRSMAIRKSMEVRESKNQESADWLRKYQTRSEAMRSTVTLHAKLLDPHRSLREMYNEKLQHHREADQQRMREYARELRGMQARVSERPYLFEQVKQRSAKANAEKMYRNTLRSAGLKEQFVEENGEGVTRWSTSSISEKSTDGSAEDEHSREENVDAGEKIEDVKEKA